jgi:hypothetical protein
MLQDHDPHFMAEVHGNVSSSETVSLEFLQRYSSSDLPKNVVSIQQRGSSQHIYDRCLQDRIDGILSRLLVKFEAR